MMKFVSGPLSCCEDLRVSDLIALVNISWIDIRLLIQSGACRAVAIC